MLKTTCLLYSTCARSILNSDRCSFQYITPPVFHHLLIRKLTRIQSLYVNQWVIKRLYPSRGKPFSTPHSSSYFLRGVPLVCLKILGRGGSKRSRMCSDFLLECMPAAYKFSDLYFLIGFTAKFIRLSPKKINKPSSLQCSF